MRPNTVKATLTPKRPRWQVENDEYAAFVRRILRAYSRRVGNGDVEALTLLVGLAEEIDAAMAEAVKGLRGCGYSWAEIGVRLGITRQAAQQRWEHRLDVRQVHDRLDMAAGAGCSLTAPVTSLRKAGDARWRSLEHMPRSLGLTIR
jgi:hypothetical protein